ncbi:MAG: Co2+/Mg2+ efflux protein ApaG [Ahrensia sp.]
MTSDIRISVSTQYLPDQSEPARRRWFWAYTVLIENQSADIVQLRRRFWRITNALGDVESVEGPGVVGEEPTIAAGDCFQYTSGCPLDTTSGTMEGHYEMQRTDGSTFRANIPAFSLDMPDTPRTLN